MVSVIISYCNTDLKFIKENIEQVSKFSDDIIICYSDKMLDGTPEDLSIIENMYGHDKYVEHHLDEELPPIAKYFPPTKYVLVPYQPDKDAKYHHNLFRWEGLKKAKHDYVFFLDADEILEGEVVKEYLETGDYKNYDVLSFKCYWYFREKNYRAKTTEEAGHICRKEICTEDYIFSEAERWEFVNRLQSLKCKYQLTHNEKVMCHHYSWVRTKEEMLQKVSAWAHKSDKNWKELIEEEFSRDFNGTDFIHKYQYEILK